MEETVLDIKQLYQSWQKSAALEVVFQPLVHISSGKPFGFEALSRPKINRESVPISLLLESCTMAKQLSEFDRVAIPVILRTASNLKFPRHQKLFVNFSPFTLLDVDFVMNALDSSGVNLHPSQLVIEISERETLPGINIPQLLAPYRRKGMAIALDDFGAGYSGLTRVVDLDPDYVKIDLGLVRDIDRNPVKHALVESTVQFAARSGRLQVLAEGIETQAELATLFELGINLGQGYLLGKPHEQLRHKSHGVALELLARRLPDPSELLHAFMTTTQRMVDGIGSGEGLASHVVHLAMRLMAASHVSLWKPEGKDLVVDYAFPAMPKQISRLELHPRHLSYQAMTERKTIVLQTAKECAQSPVAGPLGSQSLLLVPVVDRTQARALLSVGFSQPGQIRPQEIQMTEGLARLMALVTAIPGSEQDPPGVGEPVFEAMSSLMTSNDLESLLAKVMEAALSVSGGHLGYVGLLTADSLHAVTAEKETFDMAKDALWDETTYMGKGPAGRALRERRMIIIQDVETDASMNPWRQDIRADGIRAALAIPLISNGTVLGLLKVYHSRKNGFETGRIRRLQGLASLTTVLIDKWQEEHDQTRHWLATNSHYVTNVIRELTRATSAKAAYSRIEHTVRELLGGDISGLVRFKDRATVAWGEEKTVVPELWKEIVRVSETVKASRCVTSEDLEDGNSLFAMPLLVGQKAIGGIWVVYQDPEKLRRPDASDLLKPHLMVLSLVGAASLLLEDHGL